MAFKLVSFLVLSLPYLSHQDKNVQEFKSTNDLSIDNKCDLIVLKPRGYETIPFDTTEAAIVLMELAFKHELNKVSRAIHLYKI